jgi:hypothetical protein
VLHWPDGRMDLKKGRCGKRACASMNQGYVIGNNIVQPCYSLTSH